MNNMLDHRTLTSSGGLYIGGKCSSVSWELSRWRCYLEGAADQVSPVSKWCQRTWELHGTAAQNRPVPVPQTCGAPTGY